MQILSVNLFPELVRDVIEVAKTSNPHFRTYVIGYILRASGGACRNQRKN